MTGVQQRKSRLKRHAFWIDQQPKWDETNYRQDYEGEIGIILILIFAFYLCFFSNQDIIVNITKENMIVQISKGTEKDLWTFGLTIGKPTVPDNIIQVSLRQLRQI